MASSNAIRAGRAFVELFADDKPLVRGLNAAKAKLNSFGASVTKIGAGLTAAGLAILTPMLAAVKSFGNTGDAIAKMSKRTGIGVESLSQLAFATSQAGTSLEALEKSVRRMQRTITDAADGSTSAVRTFDLLGISVDDIRKMSPEDQFLKLADALAGIENPTTRAAMAMELFGRSGTELIPLMADGANGIRALMKQADALGLTLSQEDAAAAEVFNDALDQVVRVIKRTAVAIGAALSPVLLKLIDVFQVGNVTVGQWVDTNREVIRIVAAVAAGVVAAGGALIGLGYAIKVVAAGFGIAATAITATTATLAFLVTPLGAVTAALVGGIAAWLTYSNAGQAALVALADVFGQFKADAMTTITGIVDALAAGDFALATQVAVAGIRVALLGLEVAWNKVAFAVANAWGDAMLDLEKNTLDTFRGMQIAALRFGAAIKGFFEQLALEITFETGGMNRDERNQARATLKKQLADELDAEINSIIGKSSAEHAKLNAARAELERARAEGTTAEIKAAEAALEAARRKLIDATQRAAKARAAAEGRGVGFRGVDVEVPDLDDIEAKLGDVADKMVDAQDKLPEAMAIGSQAAADHILKSIAGDEDTKWAEKQVAESQKANETLKDIRSSIMNALPLAPSTI